MKRNTRVYKPSRGEQEPFARQLASTLKEGIRLRDECKARIESVERKAGEKIDAACAERDRALVGRADAVDALSSHVQLYRDFARVTPALRSRSVLRRLWWGVRFGLWGIFRYEVR